MFESGKNKSNNEKDGAIHESGYDMHDLKDSARGFKSDVKEAASAVGDDLEAVARRTGQQARHLADSAEHSLSDIGATVTHKIRNNPIQSSLIALGIGLTIGMLYRR